MEGRKVSKMKFTLILILLKRNSPFKIEWTLWCLLCTFWGLPPFLGGEDWQTIQRGGNGLPVGPFKGRFYGWNLDWKVNECAAAALFSTFDHFWYIWYIFVFTLFVALTLPLFLLKL
jgi:hypothetical protein